MVAVLHYRTEHRSLTVNQPLPGNYERLNRGENDRVSNVRLPLLLPKGKCSNVKRHRTRAHRCPHSTAYCPVHQILYGKDSIRAKSCIRLYALLYALYGH